MRKFDKKRPDKFIFDFGQIRAFERYNLSRPLALFVGGCKKRQEHKEMSVIFSQIPARLRRTLGRFVGLAGAALFSLVLASCAGGGFGRTGDAGNASDIPGVNPVSEPVSAAAGPISAESQRKVAGVVSGLNLGGSEEVSSEDIAVSNDSGILDSNPFSSPAPAARSSGWGARADSARKTPGYKAFEVAVPSDNPLMTVAVWISETSPDSPEKKLERDPEADRKFLYLRLQVFIAVRHVAQIAGGGVEVLDSEVIVVEEKRPDPKPEPACLAGEFRDQSGSCSPIFGAGLLCPAGTLPTNGITAAELNMALRLAARNGDAARVCEALRRGAVVNDNLDDAEFTPLQEAVSGGHLEAAKVLLANGAEVNKRKGGAGRSPLDLAARDDEAEVAALLRDADGRCFIETGPLCGEALVAVNFSSSGVGIVSAEGEGGALAAGGEVRQGATVMFTAIPGAGYYVSGWSGNCGGVGEVADGLDGTAKFCGLAADFDLNVRAEFSAIPSLAGPLCPSGSLSSNGLTPAELDAGLVSAAQANNLEGVCERLRRGASVEAREQSGLYRRAALMIAAHNGHLELAKLLHANGANVNSRVGNGNGGGTPHAGRWSSHGDSGFTALMYAAGMGGDAEMVGWLLDSGADANLGDSRGRLPLWEAAHYGRVEAMELLLDHGVDANGADVWGLAPLHAAGPHYSPEDGEYAEMSYAAEVAGGLLSQGAEVNARDSWGRSPLDVFAKWSHPNVAAVLRSRGGRCFVETGPLCGEAVVVTSETVCESGSLSANGMTPAELDAGLISAAQANNLEGVCEHLRRGASVEAQEQSGLHRRTALMIAAHDGHMDLARLLHANGADVNSRVGNGGMGGRANPGRWRTHGDSGFTALMYAAGAAGQAEIVEWLLDNDADPNLGDSRGRLPLWEAAFYGRMDVMGLLLDGGADVDGADVWGLAPLHAAGPHYNYGRGPEWSHAADVAGYLLSRGADVNARDSWGRSPLDVYAEWSHPNAAAVLRNGGGRCFVETGPLCEVERTAVTSETICASGSLSADGLTQAALDVRLLLAASENNMEEVCENLRRGANVEAQEPVGLYRRTALMIAAHNGYLELAKLLHANGADVNSRVGNGSGGGTPHAGRWSSHADSGFTALMYAAGMGGDAEMVGWLLDNGADANLGDSRGRLPLWEAAHYGRAEAMELLLDGGAGVNGADVWGLAPLHAAGPHYSPEDGEHAEISYAAEVAGNLLSRGAEVNARDSWGRSPLDVFAKWSHPNVAAVLRDAGGKCFVETGPLCGEAVVVTSETVCEPGSLSANGLTTAELNMTLRLAARGGDVARACEALRRGAEVNDNLDNAEFTPLQEAVSGGHLEAAKLLLTNGAEVNKRKGGTGRSPLDLAARDEEAEIAALLRDADGRCFLETGPLCGSIPAATADPATAGYSCPAGSLPRGNYTQEQLDQNFHAAGWSARADAVCKWLRRGANVDSGLDGGWLGGKTVLHRAAWGEYEIAVLLLENGADVNVKDRWSETPLHQAVAHHSGKIAVLLLENGADVNAKGFHDYTPLHDAASQGAREMVTLLLEHGADVGATNDNGETPLDVARRKKHAAIAALLEAAENLPVAAAAPAEADALAGELRTSFAGAFNPSPAFGDAFGAVPGASESFLTRLNSLMRSSAGTGGNAWNSFAGWQRENEHGRMWFSTGQRGDFGFGAGGNGAGGDLSASPFAALVGNGMLAGGETGFATDGKLRVAAFADYQAKSLLDGEDKRWTQWAARGTAIETAMTEAERFSGLSENQTRGAMTEIHLGGGDLGVALQAGAVSESDSVLSGTAGDENLRGLSSRTAFAGLSGAADLFGSGWRLRGSAHLGRSWAESEGMLLDSDLWASAFSAGLERGGWLYSNDGFVLRFSQPLRVERWEMELIGDGGARRLGADASGRQLDVDAAYRLPLSGGGWLLLSAGVRRDGGHSSSSDLEAGALFSVERGF